MSHALGTTIDDIKAKAGRKRKAQQYLKALYPFISYDDLGKFYYDKIRKYIEEN